MSDQSVVWPKCFTHGGITLAKGQLGHPYTFWTMSIQIYGLVVNFGQQSILSKLQSKCEILSNFVAFSQYLDFKRHLLCFEWSLRIVIAVNMAIAFIRRIINTPIARPDWLKAQGRATTDVPIIVFQMVNLENRKWTWIFKKLLC